MAEETRKGVRSMTINEYQKAALRTESSKEHSTEEYKILSKALEQILELETTPEEAKSVLRLLNGLMGLNGESGEVLDILKKHLFQKHPLDIVHVAKELGDICWYLALSADAIGFDLETVMKMNIAKLQERYPDGFEASRSLNRALSDI